MITKEIWDNLTEAQQHTRLVDALSELYKIDHRKHELSGELGQGRLAFVKKDLEALVLKFIEWKNTV